MGNPYKIVDDFEKAVADFSGCKYGIAIDNCSNALFLCSKYLEVKNVLIPNRTYPSVPCSIIHAGGKVSFEDLEWSEKRFYQLKPYKIYDGAQLFRKDMHKTVDEDGFLCISFSATKSINIGKGGMILTNDEKASIWFKKARYCGRNNKPLMEDDFEILGWNMYMTPEQAARGLLLFSNPIFEKPMPQYPDLSNNIIYKN